MTKKATCGVWVVKLIFGATCGAIVGMVGGQIVVWGIALFYQVTQIYEPGKGDVGVFVLIALPVGFLIGAPTGAILVLRWKPRRRDSVPSSTR